MCLFCVILRAKKSVLISDIIKNRKAIILTVIMFTGLSAYYGLDYWLMQRPCSVHVWRQTDCASYALNYFQNDRGFFLPQVHHRHAIDGSTTSEFPVIYYLASWFYKAFGFHDYYIRWIDYLIFFMALILLTLTSAYYIKNKLMAAFPSILLMMSCVIVYYAANFLPDVPALCFAIMGFYFFTRHVFNHDMSDFIWAIAFSVLASLLKISSALLFVCIFLYVLYRRATGQDPEYGWKRILVSLGGFMVVFAWLYYVKIYNEQGQYFGNLQGMMGIWDCPPEKIKYIRQRTQEEWMPALGSWKLWYLAVPALAFVAVFYRRLDKTLAFILPFLLLGCVFYLIAFFGVFDVHDYYFINVFAFPVVFAIGFFSVLEKVLPQKWLIGFIVVATFLFGMTAEDTKAQFTNRKYHTGWNADPPKGFYNIEPYLRSIGINRQELIYSPSDGSTNITLYLANNPGWTRLFGTTLQSAKDRGAKYMLITSEMLETEEFASFKEAVIGEFEGIKVVRL